MHNEFVISVSVFFIVSRIQRRVLYSVSQLQIRERTFLLGAGADDDCTAIAVFFVRQNMKYLGLTADHQIYPTYTFILYAIYVCLLQQ